MAVKFNQKEKRKHYTAVANGTKSTKKDSKFSKKEQLAYARGQRDARNESARICAYNHSTPEQREKYAAEQKAAREAWKAQHNQGN